jgi:RHS repeat-associated protein
MDRLGGVGSTLTPPAANYSVTLGETFDSGSGRSGVAATLLPDGAVLFDPSDKSRYTVRGFEDHPGFPADASVADTTANNVRTISITGAKVVEPTTTTLTSSSTENAAVLTIQFYKHDPGSGNPLPAPIKTTVITRQFAAPDQPNGYLKGYTFTVTYPDGESNSTQVWTSDPQSSSTTAKTKVTSGIESQEWVSVMSGSQRTVTFSRFLGGVLVRKTIDTFGLAPWDGGGEILTQSAVVVAGGDQITTYTYWNSPSDLNHTRIQRITNPDGSWELSALDIDGARSITLRPYGSSPPAVVNPASTSPYYAVGQVAAGQNEYVYTAEYTTLTTAAQGAGSVRGRLLNYSRYIGTTLVEKKVRPVTAPDFLESWNGAEKIYTMDAGWKSISSGSGTTALETMTGRSGQYPSSSDFLDKTYTMQEPANARVRFVSTNRQADSRSPDSTTEHSWRDQVDGRPLLTKKYLETASGSTLIELTEWIYEPTGARRLTARKVNGVEMEAWAYPTPSQANAARAETHAQGGTTTLTEYDADGRPVYQTLSGAAAATVYGASVAEQSAIVTTWTYGAFNPGNPNHPGYTVTESVQPTGQSARVTTTRYDGAGRIVSQQTPDSRARFWAYFSAAGFPRSETIYAGTTSIGSPLTITTWHNDGRIRSITGTAELPQLWTYSAPAAYRETTTRYLNGHPAEVTTVDGFGRTVSVQTPVSIDANGNALYFTFNYLYNEDGQLTARSRRSPNNGENGVERVVWEVANYTWAQDGPEAGLTVESGVSPDSSWASANMDRRKRRTLNLLDDVIPELVVSFFNPVNKVPATENVKFAWAMESEWLPAAAGGWESTPARITKTPLSARPVSSAVAGWTGHTAGAIPLGYLNDGGNIITRAVARTPLTGLLGNDLSTETRTVRSGSQFRKVVNRNGLDVSFSSPEASNAAMLYSPWREPLADFSWDTIPHWPKREVNSATGLITKRFLPNSSVLTETYTYFSSPTDHRTGRIRSSITETSGSSEQEKGVTYYHYNARGQLLASYGSGAPTTLYKYDGLGRMINLRTYRTAPSLPMPDAANIDTAISAADSAATVELTTWTYGNHPALPLPRHKSYTGQSEAIKYGYHPDGSLATRDWSRTDGANRLRTTWLYSDAGKLTATHYGSTATQSFVPVHALYTPSVTYTYEPSGLVGTRTDGTGTTRMSWRFDGSPLTEFAVDGAGTALASGRHLRRSYDASGRLTGLESSWGATLGASANTTGSGTISPAITYNYTSADRLYSVSSGGMTGTITRTSSQESLTVNFSSLYSSPYSTYNRILRNSYGQPQSHLASYTVYSGGSPWTYTLRDNTFTWDSNRLATRGEGDTTWNYIYDLKGQIHKAHRRFNATEILAGSQSVYTYDDIGNRQELKEGGTSTLDNGLRTTTYTANSLNQYETITRPQLFDVTGKRTSTSATITVNGVVHPTNGYQPNGNGLHFRREVGNTPTPLQTGDIFEPVTVTQTIGSGSPVSLTDDPLQFVPPSVTASPPRYDLDGNLLSDGRWTYSWDGENRLVKMVSVAWTQPAGGYLANATFPAVTLEFAYDGLSRRVQKKTIKNGTAEMEGYVYDGWNVVMISNLNPGNGAHLARKWSCVWRPDIGSRLYARGSWQAAGGVGGLAWLQTGIAQTVYPYYTYSQVTGNGEVHIPMMDHMGNVRHYYQIKTTANYSNPATVTGQITANLDYDAFGREVRATSPKTPTSGQPPGLAASDPWVDVLPFHFSTKFTDRESGLNYYGYRFYDPVDGRWLNRDPLAEDGGLNLFKILSNDLQQSYDYLGLTAPEGDYPCAKGCDRKTINKAIAIMSKRAAKATVDEIKLAPAAVRINTGTTGREYGGRICCNTKTGKVTATGPTPGPWEIQNNIVWVGRTINLDDTPACSPKHDKNVVVAGFYHSHPSSKNFSIGDIDSAYSRGKLPLGMAVPNSPVAHLLIPKPSTPLSKGPTGETYDINESDGTLVSNQNLQPTVPRP